MRRLRTHWLGLFGALVIMSLSLSSAFGAPPTTADDDSLTVGQQVSAFVHALQSGDQVEQCDMDEDSSSDDAPVEDGGETPADEPADTDEDGSASCDADEDADADQDEEESDQDSQESEDSTASNHGGCVAAVAQDDEAVGDNDTHGWAVSEAARVTCWEESANPDTADTDENSSDASEDEAPAQRGPGHSKPSWAGMNAGGNGVSHGKGGPHQ